MSMLELRVDLLGQDALEDEAQARPHLRGHDGEVAELLLGDAAEALHAVGADVLRRRGAEQERRLPQPLHALARSGPARSRRRGRGTCRTPRRRQPPSRLKTIRLPSRTAPRRLLAELADARPAGLGGVELLQDGLPPGPVAVGLLDPVLQLLDLLRQLGVLALPDRHRLLVVLVGGGVVDGASCAWPAPAAARASSCGSRARSRRRAPCGAAARRRGCRSGASR